MSNLDTFDIEFEVNTEEFEFELENDAADIVAYYNDFLDGIAVAITDKAVEASGSDTKDQFINNIGAIIQNGIKIETSNAQNFPIQIRLFGTAFSDFLLYNYSYATGAWWQVATIKFNDNVEAFSLSMFQNCRDLNFSSLPSTLNYIGPRCFYGCRSLSIAEIPANVHSLDYQTFYNCIGLISMILGGTGKPVTSISPSAFSGCSNLTQIIVYTTDGMPLADQPWGAVNAEITYLEA